MRTRLFATLLSFVAAAGLCGTAAAATFCVGTPTALQDALDTASTNGEANTIKVRAGTYAVPVGGFRYSDGSANSADLDLEGGWNAGCAAQDRRATLTVLDGNDTTNILRIAIGSGPGRVTLAYFDVYHGVDHNGFAPALDLIAYDGDVRVRGCRFRFNSAVDANDIVQIFAHAGAIHFEGNIVADNDAPLATALMTLSHTNDLGATFFTSNTVADNDFGHGSTRFGAVFHYRATFTNNILWGNGGPELFSFDEPLLIDNDIDEIGEPIAVGSHGNIADDPQFLGAMDRHLAPTSPAVDAGVDAPSGGAIPRDLDDHPRIVGAHMDMGAYELQDDLFADGFDG